MRVGDVQKSRMDDSLTDIPQCEEQLKTTLQCDDKEKVVFENTTLDSPILLLIGCLLTNIIHAASQEVAIFAKRVPQDRPETTGQSL